MGLTQIWASPLVVSSLIFGGYILVLGGGYAPKQVHYEGAADADLLSDSPPKTFQQHKASRSLPGTARACFAKARYGSPELYASIIFSSFESADAIPNFTVRLTSTKITQKR